MLFSSHAAAWIMEMFVDSSNCTYIYVSKVCFCVEMITIIYIYSIEYVAVFILICLSNYKIDKNSIQSGYIEYSIMLLDGNCLSS
jgi:hypothetical protein